ncbi:MAG: glycosyl hydrolase family 28-related protein [Limisphaerales bacterium]
MIFSNAISKGPWQPAGYAGQPLSGVTVAGPAGTVLSLQPQTLGPTGAFDDLRLQEPNSMPGPYSITGLVLFNKTSFANVLSTDQVVLSPTNIFAGLFADVAPAAGDTSGIRWVVEDGTNFFISTASTGLASATNPSSISQNPTSLAWYGYDPLTDITAIGAMVAPGFTNINYVGFRLEGTSATNTTSTLGIAATQLRFDVTVAVPVPARLVPLPLDQTRLTDGMLDVTKSPYFADNSGATDAHLAIQNAINDAYAANLIVFFPPGTYLCTGGLSCIQTPGPASPGQRKFANKLVGSTLGPRPVLKLADGAVVTNIIAPGGGPSPPVYPVFVQFSWVGDEGNSVIQEDPALQYCSTFRGIDIDMGNNPRVSAIRMLGAQYCVIEDVDIYGTNFGYGIDGLPGSGGSVANLNITGGKIGIRHSEYRPSPLVTGVRLTRQSSNAISTAVVRGPLVVAGFCITAPTNPAPGYAAVFCDSTNIGGNGSNPSVGNLVMVDGTIEVPGTNGIGIYNYAQDVYLQNVFVKAATNIISDAASNSSNFVVVPTNYWADAAWYSFRVGRDNGQLVLNGLDYGSHTDAVASVVSLAASAPSNLISQHLWRTNFPSWEDQPLLRITDPEFGAVPDDPQVDNAPAIQAALTAATTTDSPYFGATVFIPRGQFYVGGPIFVPAGAKLIGAGETISVLEASENWLVSNTTSVLTTENNSTNGVTLAFFALVGNEATPAYSGFPDTTTQRCLRLATVQSASSIWRDLQLDQRTGSGIAREASEPFAVFSGDGGGQVYNLCLDFGNTPLAANQPDPSFHLFSVQNTPMPLAFYEPDPEHLDQGAASVAVDNAGSVAFFAFKYEGSHQMLSATNVTHLQALGGSGNYGQATNSIIAIGQCADFQVAELCRDPGTNEETGLSWFSGLGPTLTDTRPITLVSYGVAGPQLSIARTGTNMLLSWPVTTVPFQLQTNATLNGRTTWSPAGQIPTANGSSNSISVPASSAAGFFRLIQNP